MTARYLQLVRMDVAHDHERTFNEIYDQVHVPVLAKVPGVGRAGRFPNASPTDPRYIAAYELDSPAVLQSPAWKSAAESGRWPSQVRPHTMNRHIATYEWVGSSAELTRSEESRVGKTRSTIRSTSPLSRRCLASGGTVASETPTPPIPAPSRRTSWTARPCSRARRGRRPPSPDAGPRRCARTR